MTNYEFCANWIIGEMAGRPGRILDYGCAAGEIVKLLRLGGVEAYGCDVFYEGGDYASNVPSELFESGTIKRMDGSAIPFHSEWFDIVVNNQVMEHVEDLDMVLAEVARVLKPGGLVLSLFPDRSVWREGHCGIPLLHWFPKRSRPRLYYAATLRRLGFGCFKDDKSPMEWARGFCDYLDSWTHYRPRTEIDAAYLRRFSKIRHIEDEWVQTRLGRKRLLVAWMPAFAQRLLVTKLVGMIFTASKPD